MSYERGDVVVAIDPFKDNESGRPFLVINHADTPFHGDQFIVLSLTTKTWHDERIPLADDDWVDGGAPASSSIMPWSVNSVKDEWIDYRQGTLREDVVVQAVEQLVDYVL
jgi:mRNA interferase MazF